jgi:valyl-tRNA synthetase
MATQAKLLRHIDPTALPKHFKAQECEQHWHRIWEAKGIYHYEPSRPREETFVVDTPPPTVSGALHIGHVFSYTHTDIIVRYKRMRGFNIFYPMGWDDNGLPTERRVQNYFHVKCNPQLSYTPNLQLKQATAKIRKKPMQDVSRKNFIELCHQLTQEDEQAFMNLWQRVGLSVDWREEYATIDDHCRHLAQLSFLDLYEKGHVYSQEAPTMWDVDFQTAVAQAELEDREMSIAFYRIVFGIKDSDRSFVIATTRPELLPACVGVTAHPDDERYKDFFGKHAITPLFRVPVPIFPSELADPEKGTGILMVCTFGDSTDVEWWQEQKLALRQVIGLDGRFVPVTFGSENWPSLNPDAANAYYRRLIGKTVKAAQKTMADLLHDPNGGAFGSDSPLQGEPETFTHAVKFYEKGEHPLEFVPTRQWFIRLLDKKDLLMENGNMIAWHPEHMKQRYLNWTENLKFDWCISRQRYFGVSFPLWYPLDNDGKPDYAHPLLADPTQLPVDPMIDTPLAYSEEQRNRPGGFIGESDVFDTWFTSSLSPQIGTHWSLAPERHARLFPMDLRPQAHEIIRTWAFYTITKAALHESTIPWKHIALSGWILDPDRKKMSKSKGNVVGPLDYLDNYTADGVRYWAASIRLGIDATLDEQVMKVGKRLVTKLYNAGKFVLAQQAQPASITQELDLAFVSKLHQLVEQTTNAFENFDFAHALRETENFFWNNFTDTYLELVKNRVKRNEHISDRGRDSAVAALRFGLNILLRLFAPMFPYITEEIWSWVFAEETGWESIHTALWPGDSDFKRVTTPKKPLIFDTAVVCLHAIYKAKSQAGVSLAKPIEQLTLVGNPKSLEQLQPVLADVMAATRTKNHTLEPNLELEDDQFTVLQIDFGE